MKQNTIPQIIWLCLLLVSWGAMALWSSCNRKTSPSSIERELVWSDDFNDDGLPNTNAWAYDIGGWGLPFGLSVWRWIGLGSGNN